MGLKNEENFQKKCRLCGRLGRRFTDIFTSQLSSAETKPKKKLSQLIYKCLQLQIKEDDSLPKKVCDDCNRKLASWQNFYRKCERTQKKLQQYLENWQKSSFYVSSSGQHCVTYSDNESSEISRGLSQISLADKIPAEAFQNKTHVLPQKENDTLSVNSLSKNDIPVITQKLNNNKQKYRENTIKVKNVNEYRRNKGRVKKEGAGSQKKNACAGESDLTAEQAHDIVIAEENERLQTNSSVDATDFVKKAKLLKRSLKSKKSVEIHQCHICEKTFPSRGKLKAHVATHLSLPEFQCDKCSKKFRSKFSLRSHLETHSANRNYCCHCCGRLFHTASGLCNHVKLHSEETKRFTCPLCSKQFRQAGHLEQHQRTHTGERPHHCTECEQRFTTRCQLSRHIQGVHRCAKKHKCLMCGKEFLYSTNFKAHLLRHAGQRNNKCGECGKTFVTRNALFRHRRSHTGDKPFQCDICGKKFADCSNRKRHTLRHLQQPVIPRGRKSGPRPKLARVTNLNDVASAQRERALSNIEIQPSEGQDSMKVYSKLVQVSSSSSVGSSKAQGNRNINSSKGIQISGEVVQMRSSDSAELGKLTSVRPSQLAQQLCVSSTSSQPTSYNNLISDSSNIYVNLSQDLPQFIQLCNQNTNLLIEPMVHDVTQLVQSGDTERQCADQLDPLPKENLCHFGQKLKPSTKRNDSPLCTTNVIHENYVQKSTDVSIDKADKTKLYQSQDDSRSMEIDKPKTYANLRTFLESSEVVETLSGGRNDDTGDDNGLVNVEYVTLMADVGNEFNFTSGMQEIIVLPHETRISDYDLSKNAGKFRIVVQGSENSSNRKSAFSKDQIRKEKTESVTVLTQTLPSSQNRNVKTHLPLTVEKGKTTNHILQTSSTKYNNIVKVILSDTDEIKLSTDARSVNDNVQNEMAHSSNVIQVLLETDSTSVTAQQEETDKSRQTFLVSSDTLSDEDAIVRMLNSQGTVMLSTTGTGFDLTDSHIAEGRCLTESASEAVGMAITEDQNHAASNFKSFSSVDDTVVHEISGKKENNRNINLIASDYSRETSLAAAITLD
ncbi:hypothetical protein B7P43_G10780, partial [Cryptotermes secundus]